MRPVRSAESLIPLSLQRLSQTIDEMAESQISTGTPAYVHRYCREIMIILRSKCVTVR